MRTFWAGVVAGSGGGLLAGWWLGAPAALPRTGLAEWAVGIAGLALISLGSGLTGRRTAGSPTGPTARPGAEPGPAGR